MYLAAKRKAVCASSSVLPALRFQLYSTSCLAKLDAFCDYYFATIVLGEMVSSDAENLENIVQAT